MKKLTREQIIKLLKKNDSYVNKAKTYAAIYQRIGVDYGGMNTWEYYIDHSADALIVLRDNATSVFLVCDQKGKENSWFSIWEVVDGKHYKFWAIVLMDYNNANGNYGYKDTTITHVFDLLVKIGGPKIIPEVL